MRGEEGLGASEGDDDLCHDLPSYKCTDYVRGFCLQLFWEPRYMVKQTVSRCITGMESQGAWRGLNLYLSRLTSDELYVLYYTFSPYSQGSRSCLHATSSPRSPLSPHPPHYPVPISPPHSLYIVQRCCITHGSPIHAHFSTSLLSPASL